MNNRNNTRSIKERRLSGDHNVCKGSMTVHGFMEAVRSILIMKGDEK